MTALHPHTRIHELEHEIEVLRYGRDQMWKDYRDRIAMVAKLRAWLTLVTDNYLDDYPAMAKLIHGVLEEEQ